MRNIMLVVLALVPVMVDAQSKRLIITDEDRERADQLELQRRGNQPSSEQIRAWQARRLQPAPKQTTLDIRCSGSDPGANQRCLETNRLQAQSIAETQARAEEARRRDRATFCANVRASGAKTVRAGQTRKPGSHRSQR